MEITADKKGDVVVLALSGKLDATTSKTFENKLLAQIDSGDRRFVIDLSQMDYISSSGLRVFLVAAKRLHGTDGKIVLCSVKDHVRQVFDLAGFSSIFSLHASREEAIKNL